MIFYITLALEVLLGFGTLIYISNKPVTRK